MIPFIVIYNERMVKQKRKVEAKEPLKNVAKTEDQTVSKQTSWAELGQAQHLLG